MNIGQKTQNAINRTVKSLVDEYIAEIDEAYTAAENHLDVTLKVRLSPGKEAGTVINSSISFLKGNKVNGGLLDYVDEKQPELFERSENE